jgi:hypothetical protein
LANPKGYFAVFEAAAEARGGLSICHKTDVLKAFLIDLSIKYLYIVYL